jgi:hypothetical protein
MSNPDEIQREIADLDKQINDTYAETRLPSLRPARKFPSGSWGLAVICLGWHFFADLVPPVQSFHDLSKPYVLYAGLVLAAIAVLQTVFWFFGGTPKASKAYTEATRKANELQERRRMLQQELKALKQK